MKAYVLYGGIVCIFFAGIWWLLTQGPGDITNYPPKNITVVAFGDSLVEGVGATKGNDFVSVPAKKLGRPIVNLGIVGNTTADGLARIDTALALEPGVVLLLLGGNDYIRRMDAETTRANLAKLISSFQNSGAVVVLLGVRGGIIRDGRDSMYEELADEYGATYVPDVLDGIFLKPELMYDAIHPNDAGYAVIAERLYEVFKENEL